MHIKTAEGWRPLIRNCVNHLVEAPPRYRKKLPSDECLAFIAQCEADHAEWVATREARLALNEAEAA